MTRADRSLIAIAGAARSRGRFLRNYFDVSVLYDVHALRALSVFACAGNTARDSGKNSLQNPVSHLGLSSHNLVIIINYLTMMFI